MKLIVGFGNPGPRYQKTRHNVGFELIDRLSQRWSIPCNQDLCSSQVGQGQVEGMDLVLAQPQTFMNLSGEAVEALLKHFSVDSQESLMVCDDVALPLGLIRLRSSGSSGGQLGLENVLNRLGHEKIPRLRIGIQGEQPPRDLAAYVLEPFGQSEQELVDRGLEQASEAALFWMQHGMTPAMNQFNQKVKE